jgi:hypothetical protein
MENNRMSMTKNLIIIALIFISYPPVYYEIIPFLDKEVTIIVVFIKGGL